MSDSTTITVKLDAPEIKAACENAIIEIIYEMPLLTLLGVIAAVLWGKLGRDIRARRAARSGAA